MPQTATIKSLPAAFAMMKAMRAEGVEWGEDYRGAARDALAELLEGRMAESIDRHLERVAALGQADRRNGCYARWLLTELGMIELHVPRTRTFSALKVVRAYARRAKEVDRMILACFLLGLSTRKVAIALLPILGRPVSPATVSTVVRQLDAAVATFHQRPLKDIYRVLVLDGVVLRRKTSAGALARPVLAALGLRPDGKKEVIDFRLATAESAGQWEQFLGDLARRGLTGERLEMLRVDGLPRRSGVGTLLSNATEQPGPLAALPTAFPDASPSIFWSCEPSHPHGLKVPSAKGSAVSHLSEPAQSTRSEGEQLPVLPNARQRARRSSGGDEVAETVAYAVVAGPKRSLGTVGGGDLLHQAFEVNLDGTLRNGEGAGDVLVGVAVEQAGEDLPFALREVALGLDKGAVAGLAAVVGEHAGEGARQHFLALHDQQQRQRKRLGRQLVDQIAVGTCVEQARHVGQAQLVAQDNHAQLVVVRAQAPQTVEVGVVTAMQIGNHQVGHKAVAEQLVERGEIARLAGHDELLGIEQLAQTLAKQPVGPDQDDVDGAAHAKLPLFVDTALPPRCLEYRAMVLVRPRSRLRYTLCSDRPRRQHNGSMLPRPLDGIDAASAAAIRCVASDLRYRAADHWHRPGPAQGATPLSPSPFWRHPAAAQCRHTQALSATFRT